MQSAQGLHPLYDALGTSRQSSSPPVSCRTERTGLYSCLFVKLCRLHVVAGAGDAAR